MKNENTVKARWEKLALHNEVLSFYCSYESGPHVITNVTTSSSMTVSCYLGPFKIGDGDQRK